MASFLLYTVAFPSGALRQYVGDDERGSFAASFCLLDRGYRDPGMYIVTFSVSISKDRSISLSMPFGIRMEDCRHPGLTHGVGGSAAT
jgi:hypothetical protein